MRCITRRIVVFLHKKPTPHLLHYTAFLDKVIAGWCQRINKTDRGPDVSLCNRQDVKVTASYELMNKSRLGQSLKQHCHITIEVGADFSNSVQEKSVLCC